MNTYSGHVYLPKIVLGKVTVNRLTIPGDIKVILPGAFADWGIEDLEFATPFSIKILSAAAFRGNSSNE